MSKKLNFDSIFLAAIGSKERLKWFLENNTDLVLYLDSVHTKYMAFVDITIAIIPKYKVKKELEEINSNKIFEIIKENRPDLFDLLNNQKGKDWLERQIVGLGRRFL